MKAGTIALITLSIIFILILVVLAFIFFKRKRDTRKAEERMIQLNEEMKTKNEEPLLQGISILGKETYRKVASEI